jgi:hypothetical protein
MRVTKPLDLPPCPPPNGGVHSWMMTVANKLAHAQVSQEKACLIIHEAMTRPPNPAKEVEVTVAKAYREAFTYREAAGAYKPIPGKWAIPLEKPEFCLAKLKAIAARIPKAVDADWLARRSKIRIDNRTPASYLHALFNKGEHVLVGPPTSQGCGSQSGCWNPAPRLRDNSSNGSDIWIWGHLPNVRIRELYLGLDDYEIPRRRDHLPASVPQPGSGLRADSRFCSAFSHSRRQHGKRVSRTAEVELWHAPSLMSRDFHFVTIDRIGSGSRTRAANQRLGSTSSLSISR